jgi:hypothetical protein
MDYEVRKRVTEYLGDCYARDVLRKDAMPTMPDDPEELAAFEAKLRERLDKINRIGIRGADLASRDFASYQQKRAILAALKSLEEKKNASG